MATGNRTSTVLPFPYAEAALAAAGGAWRPELPSTRDESWKYTNLARLADTDFAEPARAALEADALAHLAPFDGGEHRVVIANGHLVPELSAEAKLAGLEFKLSEPTPDASALPLVAMNAGLPGDCITMRVAPGTALDRPVRILFVASPGVAPQAWHPRVEIVLGEGASATVIEQHVAAGTGAYWSNPVVSVSLAKDAALRHYRHQAEGADAWHTAATVAELSAGAVFDNFVLSTGAALSRNEIHVDLAGEGATCHVNGGYLQDGARHADTTTVIHHEAPGCASRQSYLGVLYDTSRGVFQGQIKVARGAQKSDGEQMSRTILLSREAEMDTKPELEIYADDVKCAHGATVGELEDEQLFYLRARGLALDAARNLLIDGFMAEQLDLVGDARARGLMADAVAGWLGARLERSAA